MQIANWLTLLASVVALLSVFLSYRLAIRQIKAASRETSKKLRAEILLKEQQVWVREFRETINEILYLCDPDLDRLSPPSRAERLRLVTRLAHKVDLLLPVGRPHVDLISAITALSDLLKQGDPELDRERYERASQTTIIARRILRDEVLKVESSLEC